MNRPPRRLIATSVAIALLAACGGGDDDSTGQVGDEDGGASESTGDETDRDGDAGSGGAGGVLPSTPIAWSAIAAPAGTASTGDGVGGDAAVSTSCPLLSDASFQQLNDSSPIDELSLATVDDTGCRYRGQFTSFEILLESAAEVPIDDHSGRAYNIDVEPVVEAQDGPGENAVILVDTAFEDLGSDGLPYAFFFVLDDTAVTLRATAYDVDRDTWRSLADEVAAAIDSGAAGDLNEASSSDGGSSDETASEPAPPGDDCAFYTAAEIATVLDVDPATVTVGRLNGRDCEWADTTTGRYLAIAASELTTQGPDEYLNLYTDAIDLTSDVGVETYVLPGGGDSVAYVGGADPVWTTVRAYSNAGDDAVSAVLANLVPRLTAVPG